MKKLLWTLMGGSIAVGGVLLALGIVISIFPLQVVGGFLIGVPIAIVMIWYVPWDIFGGGD
ncbi:MAG: hypothetical protein V3W44_06565 [Dehalococcoidales bacterium]